MRTIIAGSRSCCDYAEVETAVAKCGWAPSVVISGAAKGADKLGEMWAEEHGVRVEQYPAKWYVKGLYDPGAGYKRNVLMSDKADALIALWDSQSFGTKHMIDIAVAKGMPVYVHFV